MRTICMTWMYLYPKNNITPFGSKTSVFVNDHALVAEMIKNTDDNYVFALTNSQFPSFEKWLKDYDLEKAVALCHKEYIWNFNYPAPDYKPRLKLCILKGLKQEEKKHEDQDQARV